MRTVLIVDDSDTCAETLHVALEALPDLEVRVAATAARAWAVLDQSNGAVSAVITDLHLPGMNGLDLLARMRGDARFRGMPVLVVSGTSDEGIPDRALREGASAFFSKPYSPAEVRRTLERLLA